MKLHESEKQVEALDEMRKKVNNELSCLKEKTKQELNLWSGLTTKFVMIKAFSDHLVNTVELIEKHSKEAERSKALLEGTMSEQLIFLSRATLEINDFSADLSYSEHERALCALHHGKLRDELKDLEKCLAQAVREAADMAKYKEMIEGQLIAAKETSNRDKAMLLQIQESLLSKPEEAEHRCQSERHDSEQSSAIVEKQSLQVADQLQAIRTSLQSQVEEHTCYTTHLEHCLASRRDITEGKMDVLQEVLQATQQKSVQASLEIQTLNQVIETLKKQDEESAALVADLRQEVAEGKNALNKNIEEMVHHKAIEAIEVQKSNELIRTLRDQNDESAALVANLRQEVAETKDTLNKQVEETAQRKAEIMNLNEMIGTLKDQNDESAVLITNLKQEVAEAKDTLNKQVEETAQLIAVKAAEVHNLNEAIRILKEQNAESAALAQNATDCCANLKQELVEAKGALDKQLEESAQRIAVEAAEVLNLNEVIRVLKEQNAESADLAQKSAERWTNLEQELVEAKNALDKQLEESAQRIAVEAAEVLNLNEVIRVLKEQNAESADLAQKSAERCTNLEQELVEAKDALNKQVVESAELMAKKAAEFQNLNEVIRALKEQNAESAELVARLRQEVAEAKDTLNRQVEETAQQKAVEAAEVKNLNEVIKNLKDQNDKSAELVSNLREQVAEAKVSLNKQLEETAQRMAVKTAEVHNLNEEIRILKEQNAKSAELAQNTAECCANLKQELVKAKRALDKLVEESAQRMVVKTAEVHNLNEEIRVLKEQNSESTELLARLSQELTDAKVSLNKQVEETTQRMAVKTAEVHDLNVAIRALKEQNANSAELVQSTAERCANLKQEVFEAKHALDKQVEESALQMVMKIAEIHNLNEVIRVLKDQNAKGAELVQNAAECCAFLRQDLIEAKDALDRQVEESAQQMAAKTTEVQNLNEMIRALRKQNSESAELLASLRQEIAEFQDALNKQAEETAHHKAQGTAQVHNLNEVIRVLKEQNDKSAALVAKLKFELAEAEDALSQDAHEAAHRNRVEAAEGHNLNVVIRALQEQNVENVAVIASLRQEVAEAQDSLNKIHQTAQQKAIEVQNLNQEIRTLKKQSAESAKLVASLRQELAEAKDALDKHAEDTAKRVAVEAAEVQNLKEVIRVLEEQNAESVGVVASLRKELAEAKDTLNNQVKETVQRKTMDAIETQELNEMIRILKEQNAESAKLVASLRQEVAEAQDSLNKQVQETIQWKTAEAVKVQDLNETIKILRGQNDESAVSIVKLRQEVTEAKDALVKQVGEAAQRKAVEAAEAHNLNEVIRSLKDQNSESSALVEKLRQEVAEAKNGIKELEEMEVEFCRSLVDDSRHTFKDLLDLKSWYTSDVLEEHVQHGISVKSVESNPLQNLIISFRGRHFPELKRLGAHLKYAMVAPVSAYTKLIEDSLQEKDNLKDEISHLQKKNYELCHQMVTTEKRLMNLKIQSEANLRAKEDELTRNLEKISQRNEQRISEMRKLYEFKRKESMLLETVKAEPASQRSVQGRKRSSRAKTADTISGRQNSKRRCKDKNPVVEQEDPQSKGLPQTKRSTSSNKKSNAALQSSRAKESPSPDQLVDLTFIDSLVDTIDLVSDDPYAF